MSQALCFNNITLSPVPRQDGLWIQARNLACALGYKDDRSVHKIYERNKEEFSSMMSEVVNLTTGITEGPTRIFSLRGCHLIAMFARTPVAKEFRRWVLDVLDKLAAEERAKSAKKPKALPAAQPTRKTRQKALPPTFRFMSSIDPDRPSPLPDWLECDLASIEEELVRVHGIVTKARFNIYNRLLQAAVMGTGGTGVILGKSLMPFIDDIILHPADSLMREALPTHMVRRFAELMLKA